MLFLNEVADHVRNLDRPFKFHEHCFKVMENGMGFKIKNIWAFVAIHDDGDECFCSMKLGDSWFPMVMADEARIKSMRHYAAQLAKDTKRKVTLVKFSTRTDLEET